MTARRLKTKLFVVVPSAMASPHLIAKLHISSIESKSPSEPRARRKSRREAGADELMLVDVLARVVSKPRCCDNARNHSDVAE